MVILCNQLYWNLLFTNNVKQTQTNEVFHCSCLHCICQFVLIGFVFTNENINFLVSYNKVKNTSRQSLYEIISIHTSIWIEIWVKGTIYHLSLYFKVRVSYVINYFLFTNNIYKQKNWIMGQSYDISLSHCTLKCGHPL